MELREEQNNNLTALKNIETADVFKEALKKREEDKIQISLNRRAQKPVRTKKEKVIQALKMQETILRQENLPSKPLVNHFAQKRQVKMLSYGNAHEYFGNLQKEVENDLLISNEDK